MIKYFLYNHLIDDFEIWKNNLETRNQKINIDLKFLENYKELFKFFIDLKKDIKFLIDQ